MNFSTIAVISSVVLMTGCATGPRQGGDVSYGDSKGVEQLTNEYSSTDLQLIAEAMSKKLLQSPRIANSNEVVRMRFTDFRNKTDEYIDTKMIADKIRKGLLSSGKVEFAVGDGSMRNQTNDLQRQNQSGLYDNKGTAKVGRMQAEKYRLEGSLSAIKKRSGNIRDVYYNFELSLTDIESGTIVWADEKEIRKTSGR